MYNILLCVMTLKKYIFFILKRYKHHNREIVQTICIWKEEHKNQIYLMFWLFKREPYPLLKGF